MSLQPLEEIEQQLKNCNNIDDMRLILNATLNLSRKVMFHIPAEYFDTQQKPRTLYRGRKCNSSLQKNNCTLSRLTYPPAACVKDHGRANRAGRTMFYCSDMEIGAYCETNLVIGDEVILTQWEIKKDIPLMPVGNIHFYSRLPKSFRPSSIRNSDLLLDKWLTKIFTIEVIEGQNHLYMPSIAVTEKLLSPYENGNPGAAGIIYPSMKKTNKGGTIDNLAIEPWFVDQHLSWACSEHILITSIRDEEYDVSRLDHAYELDADGRLRWKGYPARIYDKKIKRAFEVIETSQGLVGMDIKDGTILPLQRDVNGKLIHAPHFGKLI